MKTSREISGCILRLQRELELSNKLEQLTNVTTVQQLKFLPKFISGYSMGETTTYLVKGVPVTSIDNTQEYSSGCKYKAQHGDVKLDFQTKKQFFEFVRLIADFQAKNYVGTLPKRHNCDSDLHDYNMLLKHIKENYFDIATGFKNSKSKEYAFDSLQLLSNK